MLKRLGIAESSNQIESGDPKTEAKMDDFPDSIVKVKEEASDKETFKCKDCNIVLNSPSQLKEVRYLLVPFSKPLNFLLFDP